MQTALIVLSTLLTIAATVPYLIAVVQRKTKPRVVTWATWTLLTGIACAASFVDGQIPAAILMLCDTLATLAIVVLGLWFGDRSFEKFDIFCMAGALVGLLLWWIFNSPSVAVIAAVTIDFIGLLPTLKHSWLKPYEETAITFLLGSLGALATALAAGSWKITAIAYPLYIVIANLGLFLVISLSPHRKKQGEPQELRQL